MSGHRNHGGPRKGAGRKAKREIFAVALSCDDVQARLRAAIVLAWYSKAWQDRAGAVSKRRWLPSNTLQKVLDADTRELSRQLSRPPDLSVVRKKVLVSVARHFELSVSTVDRYWAKYKQGRSRT
jgi:hypothetical protein